MVTLISGGVKSGKSSRALEIARETFKTPIYFVATAEKLDGEMSERIKRHQAERGAGFITLEEPLELGAALARAAEAAKSTGIGLDLSAETGGCFAAVIDCLPMWVNNLMYYRREEEFDSLLEGLIKQLPRDCVIVTNECGLGNIPFDESTRRYNLLLAEANKKIAAAADRVEFMVSGIPLRVK
jgi:adenosylcobinamide kinase/adenosylcobinamide-phosphate guanylyltransferase